MRTFSWRGRLVPALAALCITAACSKVSRHRPGVGRSVRPAATIKDLMQSIVDPSADLVWNACTVQTEKGTISPSQEEWLMVRHETVGMSTANLLMMPGRHVAQPHEVRHPRRGLEPAEMEVLINKDRAFISAPRLHKRGWPPWPPPTPGRAKLFEVGEQIEQACGNCHSLRTGKRSAGSGLRAKARSRSSRDRPRRRLPGSVVERHGSWRAFFSHATDGTVCFFRISRPARARAPLRPGVRHAAARPNDACDAR